MKFSTIVADPPWPDVHRLSGVTRIGREFRERGIEQHYRTLSIKEISDMPVKQFASDNAHLYLWTTALHLRESFGILEAWGFCYKTILTWCKDGHLGLGKHFRTQTEHVLFGTRGSLPTLEAARTQRTFFHAPKSGHSVKPDLFIDIVERCSPGPYLELFARSQRLGWSTWGNECFEHVTLGAELNPAPENKR